MFGPSYFGKTHFGSSYFPPDGASSGQAGFVTPLPFFAAGGVAAISSGYKGLLAYWAGGAAAGIAVEEEPTAGSSGGNYGGRVLPSLADYEKRIKKLLDEERARLLNEAKSARKRLLKIEVEKLLADQRTEIRHKQEIELKSLIISESLLTIEKDLTEINRKRAKIKLKARIMRDDDEVMILLYG